MAAEKGVTPPVAFGDVGVVEGGAGARNAGAANLAREPQLVVASAVFHVQSESADEGGESVLLNGVAVECDGVDDVAAGIHRSDKSVLHPLLAALAAVVNHYLKGV